MCKRYNCVIKVFIYLFIMKIVSNVKVEAKAIEVDETAELDQESDVKAMDDESVEELPRKTLIDLIHKGQFFQDIFSEHLAPLKIQFGHVCENPHEWEQRFEQKNFETNRHQGKVRWGNKNGGYGEHYWDLNHGADGAKNNADDKE